MIAHRREDLGAGVQLTLRIRCWDKNGLLWDNNKKDA